MTIRAQAIAVCAAILAAAGASEAASLRVTPVFVDLPAGANSASLKVQNPGGTPISVQSRVYRWSQADGEESLEPTGDVVVSPPLASLTPGAENVVRLVRVNKGTGSGEASYRLIVDELPAPGQRSTGSVAMLLRQSIPVFIGGSPAQADVSWTYQISGRQLVLTGRNDGPSRLQLSRVTLADSGGRVLARNDGLVGYVLGNATMRFKLPLTGAPGAGSSIRLSGQSETGPINATVLPK